MRIHLIVAAVISLFTSAAHAAPALHLTNFIDPKIVTNFAGFETLPERPGEYPSLVYQEDGIHIEQVVNASSAIIPVISPTAFAAEGERGWYPNGGDSGYTAIRLSSGSEISAIQFLSGSAFPALWQSTALYVILLNGTVVGEGSFGIGPSFEMQIVGFSGGGFDTILFRTTRTSNDTFFSGEQNGAGIDAIAIAVAVSEPPSIILSSVALCLLASLLRYPGSARRS